MYDFWYSLGVAVMQPNLLNAIKATTPKFTFATRLIIEKADQPNASLRKAPSTGQLEINSTNAVRTAIAAFLKENFAAPPPVGLYTAGRFSQLVLIPKFNSQGLAVTFQDIINKANTAYKTAANNQTSALPAFPALIGLCMMDAIFFSKFQNKPAGQVDATTQEMFLEFGVTVVPDNKEFQIVQAFVNQQAFQEAVDYLMGAAGDLDPWTDGGTTFEQIYFWTGKSEYAIT